MYFRARYYSPELGRFISRDPLGFIDGMNLYTGYFAMYGAIDPMGLKGCSAKEVKEVADDLKESIEVIKNAAKAIKGDKKSREELELFVVEKVFDKATGSTPQGKIFNKVVKEMKKGIQEMQTRFAGVASPQANSWAMTSFFFKNQTGKIPNNGVPQRINKKGNIEEVPKGVNDPQDLYGKKENGQLYVEQQENDGKDGHGTPQMKKVWKKCTM